MTEIIFFYLHFLIFPLLWSLPVLFEPPDLQHLPHRRTIMSTGVLLLQPSQTPLAFYSLNSAHPV